MFSSVWNWCKEIRDLWRASKEHQAQQPQVERKGNELEFLPAAVEILETPASPLGRTVSLLIVSLFAIALIWAWFGKIDIESVAQGRIIPQGQVKAVQPLEIGKVSEILVHEGQHVEAGQPLVKLDPTESEVDVAQVASDLRGARMNALRVELLLDYLNVIQANHNRRVPVVDYRQRLTSRYPKIIEHLDQQNKKAPLILQQQLLDRDLELYHSMHNSLAAGIGQRQASINAVQADINRLRTLTPLFTEQEKAMAGLLASGHASQVEWLAAKEKQVETEQSLHVQLSRLSESKAELEVLQSNARQQDHQFRSEQLEELREFRSRASTAELTLTKARTREKNRYLTAPVSGTVQQLQVHTVGGVVQPAQPLMVIVPDDAVLEVEAFVLNKDIGFLRAGLHSEIKVESFPYTRYGLIPGEVRQLSRDSIEQEGIGRVYPMYVTLHENKILVGDRWEMLQPGMTVTVEVKTGKRRLLEYFLAPFLRYQDESLNER